MFSDFTIALLAGIGVGAWVYVRALRRTGGQYSKALAAAGLVAVLAFITILIVLLLINKHVGQ